MALSLAACGGSSTPVADAPAADPVVPVVPVVVTPTAQAFALTSATNVFTGGDGADTFAATHLTFNATDELAGGAGTDTLTIVDTGSADLTLAAAKVGGIEVVNITNQTGNTVAAGSTESAVVTFVDIGAYQTVTAAGLTLTAGAGGVTAAQAATAFAGGVADSSDAGGASGAVMTGTISGYTAASAGSANTVKFTSSSANTNVTDLALSGSSLSASNDVRIITLATTPGNADNTATVVINGVTITTGLAGATGDAGLATVTNSLAAKINGALGGNYAVSDGVSSVVVNSPATFTLGNFSFAGTSNTTTATSTFAPIKQTIVLNTTVPGATTAATFHVNGTSVSTATLAADSVDAVGGALATAINTAVGRTVATYTDNTNTLVVDNGGYGGLALTDFSIGNTGFASQTVNIASTGVMAATPGSVVVTDGKAAVTAATFDTTADASKFTGSTEMASVNSTGDVVFSNMVSTQSGTVKGNTAITNGNTTFGHKATATSAAIAIEDGTTAGNITLTGAGITSAAITSTGEKNTVGTIDVAAAKTVTLDASTNLTATSIATTATAGTLTISGAGAVSLGTLDAGFDTVSAAGNSGGLTAAIGSETDTVLTGSSGNDKITASTTDSIAASAKLAVNAGLGTDTLVIGDGSDINSTADGARYTGFEIAQVSTDQAFNLISGIETVNVSATAAITGGITLSGLSATQAGALNVKTDVGGDFTVTLANATGTADSVTINAASATATTNVSVEDIDIQGVETLTINATTGTATTDSTFDINGSGADKLTSLVLKGSADISFNTSGAITKGVIVDATSMTGDLTFAGAMVKASSLTAGAGKDAITTDTSAITGTAGDYVTYDAGAGNDTVTTALAALHNVNSSQGSMKIEGGLGTDSIVMGVADATFTDTPFQYVTGFEKILIEEEDADLTFTSGGYINTNFAGGLTLDMATNMASGVDADIAVTVDMGSYTGNATVLLTSAGAGTTASDDLTVTTGSGADTVTISAASWTGGSSKSAVIVSTGVGDDTISITTGTLATAGTGTNTVTAGKGADTVTFSKTNGTAETTAFDVVIAEGDSTVAAADVYTGFSMSDGSNLSDTLDLASVNISANTAGTNGTDVGNIKSHAITSGIVTFDDADTFATALTIGVSDIDDVLAYLDKAVTGTDTVAFVYDSTGDGAADSTMLFQQGATSDTALYLMGDLATSITETIASTDGLLHIA